MMWAAKLSGKYFIFHFAIARKRDLLILYWIRFKIEFFWKIDCRTLRVGG